MAGVEEAKVMVNFCKVKATYNEEQVSKAELKETIEKLGYPVTN